MKKKVKVLVAQSCPTVCDPCGIASQAPLSTEFSRQEYRSRLPFPSPGDLPNPGTESGLVHCRQILYHLIHQGSPNEALEASKSKVFPVVMYRCESWTIKKAECRRTDAFKLVLEKTLETPLDNKEIKPVNPKGNQP